MRVLFVCTGNICRSPMAEAIARDRGIEAESAGSWALDGNGATAPAVAVMGELGIDLNDHRARSIRDIDLSTYDVIYAMTPEHVGELEAEGARSELLHPLGIPIDDPYGLPIDVYRRVRDEITAAIDERLGVR